MKESITLHDKTFVPYLTNEELEAAIDRLAEKINLEHQNEKEPVILLCVLNGAIMFTSELMKRLDFPIELMTIKVASYSGTRSGGHIQEVMGITGSVKGRKVIICEDIVDTGATMVYLDKRLRESGASDVKICSMLLKPEVYKQPLKLDYVAMEIPNRFIVGFGLDYDQLGRNYKDIYVLKD
jgi:hypoxanthine phosphoribosyltransferase